MTQEQKDISLILNLSSDAILVLQKSAEATTTTQSFIERIRFRNKTICDLLCLDSKHEGDVVECVATSKFAKISEDKSESSRRYNLAQLTHKKELVGQDFSEFKLDHTDGVKRVAMKRHNILFQN